MSCTVTPLLESILTTDNPPADVIDHVRDCPECMAEIERLDVLVNKPKSWIREWAENLFIGLAAFSVFGLAVGTRNVMKESLKRIGLGGKD